MSVRKTVAIVGAGVGGLAAAARLAHAGFEVSVYEKQRGPGGRCSQLRMDGFTFDMGPTILLMPEVIRETFEAVGRKLEDYLTLHRCEPNYTVHFRDGARLTFTSDLARLSHELEQMEPGSTPHFMRFLEQGRDQYQTSLDHFVGRNFDNLWQFVSPANLRHIFRIRAHRKLYAETGRFFKDDRLRAAVTFQTMYLGISPYESPAVYGLLPYSEIGVGIWFPEGGLYALPKALERLAKELGVRFHYEAPVRRLRLEKGRARGLELESGEFVAADVVLCNADLPYAYEKLIDPEVTALPRAKKLKYTSSGFMFYLGMKGRVPGLGHHNVFFGRDYRASFDDIFKHHRVPEDLSFYVNVPNRTDPSLAPDGKDALYVLVPVPHQDPSLDWRALEKGIRERVFRRLEEEGYGALASQVEVERVFTPDDWASGFNLQKGAAFGLSHHFFQIGPFRPANQDPRVRNLFFVGASTQPGTGLPTVMLSARLVCERILKEVGVPPVAAHAVSLPAEAA